MTAFESLRDTCIYLIAQSFHFCHCNLNIAFLKILHCIQVESSFSFFLPLSLSVQLFYRSLNDLLLQRGVLLYHSPSSLQVLWKVFPWHSFLHLLQSSQHLSGVTRELFKRHTHLVKEMSKCIILSRFSKIFYNNLHLDSNSRNPAHRQRGTTFWHWVKHCSGGLKRNKHFW